MTDATEIEDFLGQPPRSRWRRWRKWIFIGVPLLIVLLLLSRCFRPAPPVHYATAPVEKHDLTVTVTATGTLAPTVQVNVGSEESGLVDKVYVHNNDRVVKGQPLAQLDLSRLRDTLVQSQATLQAALASGAQNPATGAPTTATNPPAAHG
jgi:HlyD family secretion protein